MDTFHKIMIQVADEKKAEKIMLIDLIGLSDICNYQFICSGNNQRHTQSIADAMEKAIRKELGKKPNYIEGRDAGHWILLDYGDQHIHIFLDEIRDYYAIENIWSKKKVLYQS